MDAPHCPIRIVEIDVKLNLKEYLELIGIGILFTGMYLFNEDLLRWMLS